MSGPREPNDAIVEHVSSTLRRISGPYPRPITYATELYYDLGLTGDDLDEAIESIRKPFSTDFSRMDLQLYAPNEVEHNFGLDLVRWFREWGGKRTYRSLTVASLVTAVEAGAWEDG